MVQRVEHPVEGALIGFVERRVPRDDPSDATHSTGGYGVDTRGTSCRALEPGPLALACAAVEPDHAQRSRDAIEALHRDRPGFHGSGGEARWDVSPGMLRALASHVAPGAATVETGCGASTVVFAAAGAEHVVITPDPSEFARVLEYCERIAVPTATVQLREGSSDVVLPALQDERFDLVLIDGAHSFPLPVVDFHYLSRRLRVGGVLLLDDVFIPAVGVVHRHLSTSDDWTVIGPIDDQAVAYRLRSEPTPYDFWRVQGINRTFPDYSFLPPARRWRRRAAHRLSSSPAARRVAQLPLARSVARRLSR